eukprot:Sspe_Gene.90853::Locus_62331_Transcript_3_3_Confidence_0.600_Length_1168::g.90853::m.90853
MALADATMSTSTWVQGSGREITGQDSNFPGGSWSQCHNLHCPQTLQAGSTPTMEICSTAIKTLEMVGSADSSLDTPSLKKLAEWTLEALVHDTETQLDSLLPQ